MKEIIESKLKYANSQYNKFAKQYVKSQTKQDRELALTYSTRIDLMNELLNEFNKLNNAA